jgi:YqaJ-like viral recombinase domain
VTQKKRKKDGIIRKEQGDFYSQTQAEFKAHFKNSSVESLMSEPNLMFTMNFSKPITFSYHAHEMADTIDETCKKCENFYDTFVNLSEWKKLAIFERTRAQSMSDVWDSSRLIRISGSVAGSVPKIVNPEKFLYRHFFVPFKGNEATRHGHECEPIAIQNLITLYDLNVMKCGTIISSTSSWLSCSPDGIFDSSRKILEVKCPVGKIDLKSLNVKEGVDEDSIKIYTLKPGGRNYFLQVQLNMYCAESKDALFYVWTSDDNLSVDVPYDDDYTNREVARLRKFYFSYFLPRCTDLFEQNLITLCDEYLKICLAVE